MMDIVNGDVASGVDVCIVDDTDDRASLCPTIFDAADAGLLTEGIFLQI